MERGTGRVLVVHDRVALLVPRRDKSSVSLLLLVAANAKVESSDTVTKLRSNHRITNWGRGWWLVVRTMASLMRSKVKCEVQSVPTSLVSGQCWACSLRSGQSTFPNWVRCFPRIDITIPIPRARARIDNQLEQQQQTRNSKQNEEGAPSFPVISTLEPRKATAAC